jgi:hypothetical protein
MKTSIKILCFILFASLAIAQDAGKNSNATVKWGPELEGSRRGSISGTLGYDDSGYYLTGYEKDDRNIQKLNKSMVITKVYTFEEKDPETKIKYEYDGSLYFNDRLFVFKTTMNKDAKQKELWVNEIDKTSMTVKGNAKKLATIDYTKKRNSGGFGIHTSRDEEKMMIVIAPPYDKEGDEEFNIIMCDKDMNVLWKKAITLPYPDKLFGLAKMRCDEDGNIYVLGRLFKEKKERERKQQNYSYRMIVYTNQGENKVDYEIKLENKFITDISFAINDKDEVVASGFYSKIGGYAVDGAFYMVMDSHGKEVKLASIKEFTIDFLTQGMTEREEKKAKKKDDKGKDLELYQYDMDELVLRDDGGAVLVGEQYYTRTVSYPCGNGNTCTRTYYYYNDIIVVNVDPTGKIQWAEKIPKRQVSSDGGYYSSYCLAVNGSKLHFIFNDHKDNLAPKKQGDWKNYNFGDKNGIVTLATIGSDGVVKREALFSLSETEVNIRPKVSEQINDTQLLLFGEKRKKEQFALVNFKE